MRYQFATIAVLMLFMTGCFIGKPGSGISKTETREVEDFHQVALRGSGEVNVKVGGPKSVTVTLDDNLIEMVTTEVKDGKLTIAVEGSYSSRIGLKVEIVVPELNGFFCSGSGDAIIQDVQSPSFEASVSGSGSIEASGKTDSVDVRIAGSGDVNLKQLETSDSKVSISGSGSVSVNSRKTVSVDISGSGDVDIYGDSPIVTKSISGSGDVTVHKQ